MRIVRFGARNTVVMMADQAQVIYHRETPIAYLTKYGVWYRNEEEVATDREMLDRYIKRHGGETVHRVPWEHLLNIIYTL